MSHTPPPPPSPEKKEMIYSGIVRLQVINIMNSNKKVSGDDCDLHVAGKHETNYAAFRQEAFLS